ncbi:hypothetical protein ABW16_01640 [Mycolicibacter heraklionensis]|uniref:Uncharacterized protein n=1 Tax=Mycolicibacter heraklionensis TaxID=512402 RepID=A0ABR5FKL7_9MYCO|nr:hypothetical protein [Mycolicibacter heraklionensis]KLO31569.1 hypothetical protein ABW16_01640 [Mycolicibacter heraklionensis]
MRPAAKAWIALAAGVIWWDVTCPPGETLSAGCRDARRLAPVPVISGVIYLVLHLLGWLPAEADPLQRLPDYWKR